MPSDRLRRVLPLLPGALIAALGFVWMMWDFATNGNAFLIGMLIAAAGCGWVGLANRARLEAGDRRFLDAHGIHPSKR